MTSPHGKPLRVPAHVRQERIRALLLEGQIISVPQLAAAFRVSEMTIRRDLDEMEREGQARRTHGGAVASERMSFEFHFHQRRMAAQPQKQAIAQAALRLIEPGQRLIIDNGTTTLELALALRNHEGLTVITPSLAVASALQYSHGIHTILLGGSLRHGRPDLAGGVTEFTLDLFAVDLVFQGADGIDAEGWIYNEDVQLARVDQKMRERGRQTYILTDSNKLNQTALVRNGRIHEVAGLITDNGAPRGLVSKWRRQGVCINVVNVTSHAKGRQSKRLKSLRVTETGETA